MSTIDWDEIETALTSFIQKIPTNISKTDREKAIPRARCGIHYAVPGGRIIPFCTMNTLHRREVERKFARPLEQEEATPLADIQEANTQPRPPHTSDTGEY